MDKIKWIKNEYVEGINLDLSYLSKNSTVEVRKFHEKFKEYDYTPLYKLNNLAKEFGLKNIYIKDESCRFNLNAFKVLGALYAIGKYLSEELDIPLEEIDFNNHKLKSIKKTFITATDGNHGRAVAWASNKLNQDCIVYMPKGSTSQRIKAIENENAKVVVIDGNYDEAVKLSEAAALENGYIVIQDTAWDGYEKIPMWIMKGYTTIISEVLDQIKNEKITHVFLQAGVGSFAGSILGYLIENLEEDAPTCIIVEPDKADCLYRSIEAGQIQIVEGDLNTIMAGLACGNPNYISYEIIKKHSDFLLSCSDDISKIGMRILSSPIFDDYRIISGESGAVGMGALYKICKDNKYEDLKVELDLNSKSNILIISTEGNTDFNKYLEIIWGL
ncbi:MAG TPA: diaminopropionate ammonia-lyase [Tissierellaceae bacterium]